MDATTASQSRSRHGLLLTALALTVALLVTLLQPGRADAKTALPARTATEASWGKSVLTLLNQERAAHHLHAVTSNAKLLNSARGHNLAMARANLMSHQEKGEPALGSRVTAAGYKWSWAGENIGWNSQVTGAGVLMLQKMMYNEVAPNDGHRLNILNTHFTNVGVDVYVDKTHHKVWLTVDFGRP
ncbi:CAP domain-containing protein [uncultured Jatrophihabitans sp.]|uniref:CAP domain-containing protein n=1 Tax=uncultured Jatrophihabitans sp. TaxID=1610747 RepID=UPI0035CC778E